MVTLSRHLFSDCFPQVARLPYLRFNDYTPPDARAGLYQPTLWYTTVRSDCRVAVNPLPQGYEGRTFNQCSHLIFTYHLTKYYLSQGK